ncbi:hypothetical protein BKA65DRAFT_593243 [Rhexocercosporidium sp. MPI-PUGE-AT-0058]|nr:hypothetical protein BKA65DRAFT_593243 [Rhexocercosporidium sp. MPI-PUGE-AT-0058]
MRFALFAAATVFLSPVRATFGPSNDDGGIGSPSYDKDGKHAKPNKTYNWDNDDDDDKHDYHKSKKIDWTKTHAEKSHQTYHIPKTHGTNSGKDHKTITYSDAPKYPLSSSADTLPGYTFIPQPSTESVTSNTVSVVIIPTPQPVTSIAPAMSSRVIPSTTTPPQQGNTTVPPPPIFTGDAVASTSQRISLLITIGAVWLVTIVM